MVFDGNIVIKQLIEGVFSIVKIFRIPNIVFFKILNITFHLSLSGFPVCRFFADKS